MLKILVTYLTNKMKKMKKNKKGIEISYLLRHKPDGLNMNKQGWVDVNTLLNKTKITLLELEKIVSTNNKKRFSFNDDNTMIRANQGHSIPWVDVGLKSKIPPKFLYHGTASKNLKSIKKNGLSKMKRQHVHLSVDYDTALNVAKRYCKNDTPHIFKIDTYPMIVDKVKFYISENGIWLVEHIDPKYLD